MEPFTQLDGVVAPLDRANVDTDAILPKQFMKSILRTGFGPNLFDELRYKDRGEPGQSTPDRRLNPDFSLNMPRYKQSSILLTRHNFGCGSSREHAPWALRDFGFRALIAPSFADIFFGNCFKNGILPIVLPAVEVNELFALVYQNSGYRLKIDLPSQTIMDLARRTWHFDIEASIKAGLLQGLDDIDITYAKSAKIRTYEGLRRKQEPWMFPADVKHYPKV